MKTKTHNMMIFCCLDGILSLSLFPGMSLYVCSHIDTYIHAQVYEFSVSRHVYICVYILYADHDDNLLFGVGPLLWARPFESVSVRIVRVWAMDFAVKRVAAIVMVHGLHVCVD